MTRRRTGWKRESGFTLLDLTLTLSVFLVAASLGIPALFQFLHRSRIEGSALEAVMILHAARLEAITRGAPAVVLIDEDRREFIAFADVDGVGSEDPPDGLFNPVSGDPLRETDYEIGRFRLPAGVSLSDPEGHTGMASIDGFANPAPIPPQLAFFRIDGSVADAGAFRLADARGNFFEARIAAANTARVALRKWDGSAWRERGEEGAWEWR